MADPDSVDEWLALARQHEISARILVGNKHIASQGHWHAGTAVECALKAYIMRVERLNGWLSIEARRDLYTHDLRELVRIAGIMIGTRDRGRSSWFMVLQWNRNQGYDPKPMPRKVARDMLEAAFGPDGVVTWIRSSLT